MSPAAKVLCLLGLCAAAATAQAQNSAVYVSHSTPAVMQPGQSYPVSVTMQNTGTSTWTAANNYKLGSRNPTNNTRWGLNRVLLPHSVPPGTNVTFTFNVTAPTAHGMYDFQWQMLRDGVGWINSPMPNLKLAVGTATYAEFVSQSVPASMTANQAYPASVTMKNNGSTTWTPGDYCLRSQNPQNNLNWSVNRVELPNAVAPGETVTFNFNITPQVNGWLYFQWQMAHNGTNIGELAPYEMRNVGGTNSAGFVSQNVPAQMDAGTSQPVSITLQNTGTTTWRSVNSYKLGTSNSPWGLNRVNLPHDVPPGQTVTFNFNVTVPAVHKDYEFWWQLLRDGVGWFQQATPWTIVTVGSTNAAFVSQSVPSSMVQTFTYPASVTMQNTGTFTWQPGQHYLQSENPQGNNNWALNRVDLTSPVAPGQSAAFNFDVIPSTVGTVDFQWRMAKAAGPFGQSSTNVPVAVSAPVNDAAFITQVAPSSMVPSQTSPVSITLQNTGTSIWRASTFKLASQNPADNTTWGTNRRALLEDVWPGESATFTFNITAPTTPGTYNFQWQMIEEGAQAFGALTTNVAVNVQALPAGSLHFIHADHLNTPRLVANAAGQTVWLWHQAEPFGNNVPDENPSGLGTFDLPLRLPGQYFDIETNLHYNYFRDYDAKLGRYMESDPIGLGGGLNTYAYAEGYPVGVSDRFGLFTPRVHREITEAALSELGITCSAFGNLGGAVAGVDSLPGSQHPSRAHWHAMAGQDMSTEAAQENYYQHVNEEMGKCTLLGLAKALHAMQDSVAPGHVGYQSYSGFFSLGWGHFTGDLGDPKSRSEATALSSTAIRDALSRCPCLCK